jgi:hypothetical protein
MTLTSLGSYAAIYRCYLPSDAQQAICQLPRGESRFHVGQLYIREVARDKAKPFPLQLSLSDLRNLPVRDRATMSQTDFLTFKLSQTETDDYDG